MEISSAFETMAELSIAVAGFAGIIVVLGERIDQLHPADRLRLWWLLSNSAGGVVLGLLPSVLDSAFVHESTIWRVWSACYLVVGAVWLGVSLPMIRAMSPSSSLAMTLSARVPAGCRPPVGLSGPKAALSGDQEDSGLHDLIARGEA